MAAALFCGGLGLAMLAKSIGGQSSTAALAFPRLLHRLDELSRL
jgi:hypothetical protein